MTPKNLNINAADFISSVSDERMRQDCKLLTEMIIDITGFSPKMWGTSIVGFGKYHYKYDSGHEGDTCVIGFSPRKQSISLYLAPGILNDEVLKQIGHVKAGKGCLYIRRMSDIDLDQLKALITKSVRVIAERFGQESLHAND